MEVVQLLVTHGADVHSEDNRHVSCIMIAFRKAHVKVIKVLVRHVTQFPPDHDCLRYIATLTDKVSQPSERRLTGHFNQHLMSQLDRHVTVNWRGNIRCIFV